MAVRQLRFERKIDRAKIRRLLYRNRDEITRIRVHFDYKIRSLRGWLYRFLSEEGYPRFADGLRGIPLEELIAALEGRKLPPRSADVFGRITRDAEMVAEIDELELYPEDVRALGDKELLDRAIELKSVERDFLEEFAETIRRYVPEHPEWSDEAGRYLERVRGRLARLLEMAPLWRVHLSHMWYRSYRARETPDPFAMVSCFVYTTKPDEWPEELLRDALAFLEEDSEAFPTLGLAEYSVSKAARRRGFGGFAGGAYYKVEGLEKDEVDRDELGEYEEDQLRYLVMFYRIVGGVPRIYREYWGRLERTPEGWRIYPQDKSEPKWKKPEELGWPEVLEL